MDTDISILFSRDPLSYTQQDRAAIVARFREARGQFTAGNLKAGSTKPKTEKQKKADELSEKLNLKLDL